MDRIMKILGFLVEIIYNWGHLGLKMDLSLGLKAKLWRVLGLAGFRYGSKVGFMADEKEEGETGTNPSYVYPIR